MRRMDGDASSARTCARAAGTTSGLARAPDPPWEVLRGRAHSGKVAERAEGDAAKRIRLAHELDGPLHPLVLQPQRH